MIVNCFANREIFGSNNYFVVLMLLAITSSFINIMKQRISILYGYLSL